MAAIRVCSRNQSLAPTVRDAALAVFSALAAAEAEAHGEPIEDVHFHEVGAVDAIVDIVGACAGLTCLGVEQIASRPVAVGSGWVLRPTDCSPFPPLPPQSFSQSVNANPAGPAWHSQAGELLTPTGAAILATLASWNVAAFVPDRSAYGFGTRELPWPNALRLWVGETSRAGDDRG